MSVRIEQGGPDSAVWTVVLDRPHRRNAVDGPTAAALADAFRAFEADPGARVAVLWGAGGTFCSGADLHAMSNSLEPEIFRDAPMGPSRMSLDKPVIAAVSGYAVAGGLELALWCDLRVAEQDATFGVFCRRWGVPLIDGGTVRLPRVVGFGRAMDLILTGRPVDAAEALSIGLVNRVVPSGTARAAAEQLAAELAVLPQRTLRSDRRSAYEVAGKNDEAALAIEFGHGLASLQAEGAATVADFRAGAGRHGTSADATTAETSDTGGAASGSGESQQRTLQ